MTSLELKLLAFLVVFYPFVTSSIENPKVAMEMSEGDGNRRDLVYAVQFHHKFADCQYLLEQYLPASVYIKSDQLDKLNTRRSLKVLHPEWMDIELTADMAQPFTILLLGKPKARESFTLPIYFRHVASYAEDYTEVEITTPVVYMSCPDKGSHLWDKELLVTPDVVYCLDADSRTLTEYGSTKETKDNENECTWHLLNANHMGERIIQAKIAVEKRKGRSVTVCVAIFVSFGVSLWNVYKALHPLHRAQHLDQ